MVCSSYTKKLFLCHLFESNLRPLFTSRSNGEDACLTTESTEILCASAPTPAPAPAPTPIDSGGPIPTPPNDGKWYADWVSGDEICKNDGNEPDYMVMNAALWLFKNRESCCKLILSILCILIVLYWCNV
jgi:hypothetical protein